MAFIALITTTRPDRPDPVTVLAAIQTATGDPTAVLFHDWRGLWRGEKATAWTAPEIAEAQRIVDTTAALTPQLAAQRAIDNFPIEYRALVLALLNEINIVRAALVPPLAARTANEAITAIRAKAGLLS